MDVDAAPPRQSSPMIAFFDLAHFPWPEPRLSDIRMRRALMDDSLIFDILLNSGGILDTFALYPPEDPAALQALLDAIDASTYDVLKKDCLVYFLLKWHEDFRERSFQEARCIPPQFAALADAYWHLDTGKNLPRAVAILSDARINRDYASKIIRALSLDENPAPLIRKYIQTAKPALVEPPDIEAYTLALAHSSILEAWQFSRTFNEEDITRTRLWHKIIEWSIHPKPRSAALQTLLTLPLSPFEQTILTNFALKPPVPTNPTGTTNEPIKFTSIALLQDLICVRYIQAGAYPKAIELDKLFKSTTHPQHLKHTKARSDMVKSVYDALPSVEKRMLQLNIESGASSREAQGRPQPGPTQTPARPAKAANGNATPADAGADLSLSQSWQQVSVPDTLLPKSTPLKDVHVPKPRPSFGTPGGAAGATMSPFGNTGPLIPIIFGPNSVSNTLEAAAAAAASGSGTPNKNLPLSGSTSTNPFGASTSGTPVGFKLSGTAQRLAFGVAGPVSSPVSGVKVARQFGGAGHRAQTPLRTSTTSGQTPTQQPFVSASKQANAFYTPPTALAQSGSGSGPNLNASFGASTLNFNANINGNANGNAIANGSAKVTGKKMGGIKRAFEDDVADEEEDGGRDTGPPKRSIRDVDMGEDGEEEEDNEERGRKTKRGKETVADTSGEVEEQEEEDEEEEHAPAKGKSKRTRASGGGGGITDDDAASLQYSVFSGKAVPAAASATTKAKSRASTGRKQPVTKKKTAPGGFGSFGGSFGEEDGSPILESQQFLAPPPPAQQKTRTRVSRSNSNANANTTSHGTAISGTSTASAASNAGKQPAKKRARQSKEFDNPQNNSRGRANLNRSIPGGFSHDTDDGEDDDDEEEDEVPELPLHLLPPPSQQLGKSKSTSKAKASGVRKANSVRSAASVDTAEELESGVTTRRSSRLKTGGSVAGGSVGGSPEPPAATTGKRKSTTAGRRKR